MGGIFKRFLKESEDNQDLITGSEADIEKQTVNEGGLFFGWREKVKKYAKNEK
jgi:hypothetical protein